MSTLKILPPVVSDRGDGDEAKPTTLCQRCKQLDLTVDRFIIGNVSVDRQRYESKKADVKFRIKSGRSLKDFATLSEMRASSNACPFCQLISSAMECYSPGKINDSTSCCLSWEVDGRQVGSGAGLVNSTRRIRVSWSEITSKTQEVSIVFVAPRDPLRPNSDATSRWERETHFLGRELGNQKEKQALIKSWIDLCLNEHENACRDTHSTEHDFKALVEETYFGVIDVADMQLKGLPIENGKPEPFVALSYVWGKKGPNDTDYVTTRGNVTTYIRHGGLETVWDVLPRTLQDSVLLVSRLGYRYVWIDALCIVQDSDSSWQLNAQAMHLVYGNALFTICAAEGMDSTAGLPAAGPVLQARQNTNGDQNIRMHGSRPLSAECAPGVRLMVTRPLEAVVNDSEWNTRAWTFQERVLSRRCLIFAEGRVYFQCRTTGISQDIYTDGQSSGWSLDRTNSPLRTLRELQQRPLWFYMKYIGMYTGRQLTKPRDILAAFEGISWLLGRYMEAPSLFGLPTSHFDLALLWSPVKALKVRRPKKLSKFQNKSCTTDTQGNCTCCTHDEFNLFADSQFPTWSWSGWMDGRIEYQLDMIEGCLLNVSEWLRRHTWIQWYIRNEKGHLRPLWEIFTRTAGQQQTNRRNESEDGSRWQGYGTLHHHDNGTDHERRRQLRRDIQEMRQEIRDLRRQRATQEDNASPYHVPHASSDDGELPVRYVVVNRTRSPPEKVDDWTQNSSARLSLVRERVVRIDDTPEYFSDDVDNIEVIRQHVPVERQGSTVLNSPSDSDMGAGQNMTYQRVGNERYTRSRSHSRIRANSKSTTRERSNSGSYHSFNRTPSGTPAYEDKYGRIIRGDVPRADGKMFHSILPDNPFGVIRDTSNGPKESDKQYMPVLQFWTWLTELHVSIRDKEELEVSVNDSDDSAKGYGKMVATKQSDNDLCQCDIIDVEGDWCGSIGLEEAWIRPKDGRIFPFIAISDAKAFTHDECLDWTYYIPKERNESEWDLFYVLLLNRNEERGLWERVGLGKVFKVAFPKDQWHEIKLG